MLELLRIKSLALIDDLELEFASGLNVLTGETGAGKSFIVGAVNFLTGEKMSPDMVRPGRDKAVVEALFILDGEDLVIRRELAADTGRSRIYVNDSLASQETLRELKPRLVLHVGQHGQQRLLSPAFQARLLDDFLDDPAPLAAVAGLLRELAGVGDAMRSFDARCRALEERRQLLEYQRDAIAKVKPRRGEEEALLARRAALQKYAKSREAINAALGLILGETGLSAAFSALEREIAAVAGNFPDYAEDAKTLESARLHLRDLAGRLRRQSVVAGEQEGGDEGEEGVGELDAEAVEARLWELAQLKRKLKKELDAIVDLGREIEENLSFLDACGLDLARLRKREKELRANLKPALGDLNAARRRAAENLSARLEKELAGLGFAKELAVPFEFTPHEVYRAPGGEESLHEERARLLFAPNPGQPAQPLDRIASGGELSRFLLAVIGLQARAEQPTLVFDEVDAGIGGLTLTRVGERVRDLSRDCQTLLITHWPQLAALADRHFQVRKEVRDGQTHTLCARLDKNAVRQELSRMAGGGGQGRAMAQGLLGEE